MLSRRERRGIAKSMGMLPKKESYKQMTERFSRSSIAGKMIHTYRLQELKNLEIESLPSEEDPSSEENQINPYGFLGQ